MEQFADRKCCCYEHSASSSQTGKNGQNSWALTDILYVFLMDMMLAGRVQALNNRVAHAMVSHLHRRGSEAHCSWQALPKRPMQTLALKGSAEYFAVAVTKGDDSLSPEVDTFGQSSRLAEHRPCH